MRQLKKIHDNDRPVLITNSFRGVDLNSPEANYHVIAFDYEDDWLALDVFHGITDGIGSYQVLKTLLYYYCTEKYNVALSTNGVRLEEDDIRPEEWEEPVANRKDFNGAERYIRDFRTLTSPPPSGLGVEIAAVGGRFTIDFIQTFSSDIYVNAFLKELEENNIRYELQEVSRLELPEFKCPWD